MRNKIAKASKVLTGIIMVLAVLLTAVLMLTSDNDMAKNMVRAFEEIGSTLNIFFVATYLIMGLSLVLIVVFAIYNIFVKPKGAKNSLIGVGILVAILLVSFLLSNSNIDPEFATKMADTIEVTPSLSRQVGAGLIATYILGALSILAIVYTAVIKLIKG